MPVMSNIVLDDAASPPVSHTFKPISLVNNLGKYSDNAAGTLAIWPRISCSVRPAANGNNGHKTIWKIELPFKTEQDDGQCCVPIGTTPPQNMVTIETLMSSASPLSEMDDIIAFLQGLVSNAQFLATASGESLR